MKLILSRQILLLCVLALGAGCAVFETRKEPSAAPMVPPKALAVPVGKNWQVIEEAPNLSDERNRVPFQTEQSIQPAGVSPVVPTVGGTPAPPGEKRKIETR